MEDNKLDPFYQERHEVLGGEDMPAVIAKPKEKTLDDKSFSVDNEGKSNHYTIPFRVQTFHTPNNYGPRESKSEDHVPQEFPIASAKELNSNAKITYKIHASGHFVIISCYTNWGKDAFSIVASEENLRKILCVQRSSIIIDQTNLSKVQMYGIIQTLKRIDRKIVLARIKKQGKDMLVAKYVD